MTKAHVVVGEHAGAASTYVGMTRGRTTNVAHLVAADPAEAREQWISVFARDGADLGPAQAGVRAAEEAARYAPSPTPVVRRPEPEDRRRLTPRAGTGRGVGR